jgi:peroxiredoxin
MSTPTRHGKTREDRAAARAAAARQAARRRLLVRATIGIVVVGAILFGIFRAGRHTGVTGGGGRFQVGQPATGADAPAIQLASTAGGQFDLAAQQGKTVLLYFQEGVSCQPCWDQIRDIEAGEARFKALGIDEVVSITGNPLTDIRQKVSDEGLRTPVLADPDLAVSKTYHANSFGMMGTGADGHTFIVVGPDGKIRWRADYGGAPNYTMYVPVDQLVADLRAGLGAK